MEENYRMDPQDPVKDEGAQKGEAEGPAGHGSCCDECRRTCKRNFWTEVLRTVTKVAGVILAAFGLSSFEADD